MEEQMHAHEMHHFPEMIRHHTQAIHHFASRHLEAEEKRKTAEQDARDLKNRLRMLQMEEEKALKRVAKMHLRAELAHKHHQDRIDHAQALAKVRYERHYHEGEGRVFTSAAEKRLDHLMHPGNVPPTQAPATPEAKARVAEIHRREFEAAAAAKEAVVQEKAAAAAALREKSEELQRKIDDRNAEFAAKMHAHKEMIRLAEIAAERAKHEAEVTRLQLVHKEHEQKVAKEEAEAEKAVASLSALERQEEELIARLHAAAALQEEAYTRLESVLTSEKDNLNDIADPLDFKPHQHIIEVDGVVTVVGADAIIKGNGSYGGGSGGTARRSSTMSSGRRVSTSFGAGGGVAGGSSSSGSGSGSASSMVSPRTTTSIGTYTGSSPLQQQQQQATSSSSSWSPSSASFSVLPASGKSGAVSAGAGNRRASRVSVASGATGGTTYAGRENGVAKSLHAIAGSRSMGVHLFAPVGAGGRKTASSSTTRTSSAQHENLSDLYSTIAANKRAVAAAAHSKSSPTSSSSSNKNSASILLSSPPTSMSSYVPAPLVVARASPTTGNSNTDDTITAGSISPSQ